MDRLDRVRSYADAVYEEAKTAGGRREAFAHSYGVAECGALLALRRGLDPEIARAAGLLHDIYAYKTGFRPLHSHNGADMAKVVCNHELKGLFSDHEKIVILSAIYHHGDKGHFHDAYDELLKDADAFQRRLEGTPSEGFAAIRVYMVEKELGLPGGEKPAEAAPPEEKSRFSRAALAQIAGALAAKAIRGERGDADFEEIIRYFPEVTAFNELKNAWCAAFVYSCALTAGLRLPIRPLPNTLRIACVEGWYDWAKRSGFIRERGGGFTPEKGDIVVYQDIIPPENKPEAHTWHDHIGVLLSCESGGLVVAEGNVGNQNVSGVMRRREDDTIACYIRIPDGYVYDGWKIDYKTRHLRTEDYRADSPRG